MASSNPKFAVLGSGNSGQAFAADLTLRGFSVNLSDIPGFEPNLVTIEKKGGIEISGEASKGFAELKMITMDPREAVRGVDIIIIGGSAFSHEPICRSLARYFEDGQYLWFISNFGAMRFNNWKKELNIIADVTPVETMSLIYAARALEPGKVVVFGVKDKLPTAALPARRTEDFLTKANMAFPQLVGAENILITSINNFNPIVHPPIVLFNAGRIEATDPKSWNLYVDGATESVTMVMLSMDKERMSLLSHLGLSGLAFKDAYQALYMHYPIARATMSLSEAIRKSPVHSNPMLMAPSTLNSRYLTEDISFGLVPWSSIGHNWGLPTPTIDAIIQIGSTMLGADFVNEGLSAKDLAVEGMSLEEVLQSVL
jgi:opine dehydrogenase